MDNVIGKEIADLEAMIWQRIEGISLSIRNHNDYEKDLLEKLELHRSKRSAATILYTEAKEELARLKQYKEWVKDKQID